MVALRSSLAALLAFWFGLLGFAPAALAFCGFYVAKADTKLYNQASQVIIARDGNRTILTMANDFKGDVKDFALVVPVPTKIEKDQVRVTDPAIVERLDAFSAPRLVEYFDDDPCATLTYESMDRALPATAPLPRKMARQASSLGVTVEASFSVGEYDIVVLSAQESDGLEIWLRQNGYRLPANASPLLQPYIRQGMRFFVAKVNLKEFQTNGFRRLRPLAIAYASPKFMLPIRLGMANAAGAQDLFVYLLTPNGRVELANYRTVKVPSDAEIPTFVKQEFQPFYQAMFETAYEREGRRVAFLEYAWDMANCDPCSAAPLSPEELRKAGVFWLDAPMARSRRPVPPGFVPPPTSGVFITRLHVRYTRDTFPADLTFQATNNRELFQGRYVMRHPFKGEANCDAGRQYKRGLRARFDREAQTLANLTGWDIGDIRKKIDYSAAGVSSTGNSDSFWRWIWK